MTKLAMAALAATAIMTTAPAMAQTVVTFEGLADQVAVNGYYNGGTASDGTSGPNLGVQFSGFNSYQNGGTPPSTVGYNTNNPAIADVAAGFSSLSFMYGFLDNGTISVYSGLDGGGTFLGNVNFTANLETTSDPFSAGSIVFTGTARSFLLTGTPDELALDNITFGAAANAGVPEPATWAMMLVGFGMVGAGLRYRRKSTPVRFA